MAHGAEQKGPDPASAVRADDEELRGHRLLDQRPRRCVADDDAPLPEQTVDDTDLGWSEPLDEADDDERLLREKPPHW